MMKKLCCLLFLVPFFAMAQKEITHTVGPKESLSSIGRLYNINGRELANYNKIDYNKGLAIGQVLKIPGQHAAAATTTPVAVTKTPEVKKEIVTKEPEVKKEPVAEKNATPIYHTVAKKETLYHISTLYNKVPIADIKKWNHLTSDALNEGAQLIVGYTKGNAAPVVTKKEEVKAPDTKVADAEAKKEMKKKEEAEKKAANDMAETVKHQEDKVVNKETPPPPPPVKNVEVVTTPVNNTKAVDFKGGIFKNLFEEQTKGRSLITETGAGGIFKSTSGWEDGKYYCLHNNAPAGTILKITNTATGKTVYAKVLDLITDIKQNNGLIVRISNAAADALGVTDNKLDCTINYSK
jgi:LysM repeat protein